MSDLLAGQPVLLLFVLMAVGTALGALRYRGLALGPAAVLFAALALSAWDERLALPEVLGTFGLAVFAYAIGVTAGPSFFASLRTGVRPVLLVVAALVLAAGLTYGLGRLLGLDTGSVAGLYAGATTNTPALAAAVVRLDGAPEPTVAYSLSYVGGVLVMLAAATLALRAGRQHPTRDDVEVPQSVRNVTVEVLHDVLEPVRTLGRTAHGRVLFSRVLDPRTGLRIPGGDTVLRPGETVLLVGPGEALEELTARLGRRAEHGLEQDRTELDYRRIVLSRRSLAGRTVAGLGLWDRFGARATRVRRADQDLLATGGLVLQAGDRIRVAAPREVMPRVAAYLGDSEHGVADINPLGLATGAALGLLLGLVPVPVPGVGVLELGAAAGPLVVGLVLGHVGRTGRLVWTLPHQAAETLTQVGLLLFLAYAGGRAGAAFVEAVRTPLGLQLVLAGLAVTLLHAVVLVLLGRHWLAAAGPRLAGMVAGSQTQPAVLASANEATQHDPRVSLGYALVYPVAMVVKILLVQVLTMV